MAKMFRKTRELVRRFLPEIDTNKNYTLDEIESIYQAALEKQQLCQNAFRLSTTKESGFKPGVKVVDIQAPENVYIVHKVDARGYLFFKGKSGRHNPRYYRVVS